jgi:alpha-glucosidase
MVAEYDRLVPEDEWPNWVLGNHDQHRIASRVGAAQARVAAMLLLTLRGTPTLYYGDEIGMEDVHIPPDLIQDPYEKNEPGLGLGRDPQRTPMQWDDSPQAGFTTGTPWLPVAENFHTRNVKALAADETSILNLYRRLIRLRHQRKPLSVGRYSQVHCERNVISYQRSDGGERLEILLNFGHEPERVRLQAPGKVLLSTHLDRAGETLSENCDLRPNEGVIVELR